jgi:hypothetical protein
MKPLSIFFLLFTLCASPVFAQNNGQSSPVKLLVGGALELGGDRAGWVTGENGETQLIRGAQGGVFSDGCTTALAFSGSVHAARHRWL